MNLQKLFELQRRLDDHIEKEHPQEPGEDRLAKKILALQVELGELANELPEVFKFWSIKKNNYEKALKEYVDGLHFILSIGLELGVPYEMLLGKPQVNETIEDDFINLYHDVFIIHQVSKHRLEKKTMRIYYELLLEDFISLGERLGFTWKQIEQAYMEKNAENHRRQDSGVY